MFSLVLLALAALSPIEAAEVAARIVGRPDIAPALVKICQRESRCKAIGVHARDAWVSRSGWTGQVQLGHIDRECQPYKKGQWATRGAWGLNASVHWRYLPACYQPEVLDVPIVSAVVAAKKFLKRCDGRRDSPWCPSR